MQGHHKSVGNVHFWPKANISSCTSHVRFRKKSGSKVDPFFRELSLLDLHRPNSKFGICRQSFSPRDKPRGECSLCLDENDGPSSFAAPQVLMRQRVWPALLAPAYVPHALASDEDE